MNDEAAFLAAIAAAPDEDALRLAFADWLDEHDRPGEAELIRVQIELEPIRDRHGEPRTDELHERAQTLYWPLRTAAINWFSRLVGNSAYSLEYVFRRGFLEELHLPVQWVIAHGAAIRARFPLLRKLVVFRLNGWGERLAACEHLRGLRELDLGGWYSDADAEALACSPHLADLEVLTFWRGGWQGDSSADAQLRALAASKAWPNLRKLRVMLAGPSSVELANAAAGRPIAEAIDPDEWLFPFRADFADGFLIGKLPDGTQVFACEAWAGEGLATIAILFSAAGDEIERREITFPADALWSPEMSALTGDARWDKEEELRAKRLQHLRDALGFEPAFIRVRGFEVGNGIGAYRYRNRVEDAIGATDDPDAPPESDLTGALGVGRLVYDWVTSASYLFMCGNDWWCDGTGRATST